MRSITPYLQKLFREIGAQTFAEILSIEVSSIPERLVSGTKQPGLMNLRRRARQEGAKKLALMLTVDREPMPLRRLAGVGLAIT